MNKTRQQELTRWLKEQSILSRRWLMISRALGVISGLLIVGQASAAGADPSSHDYGEYSGDGAGIAVYRPGLILFCGPGGMAARAGRFLCRAAYSL